MKKLFASVDAAGAGGLCRASRAHPRSRPPSRRRRRPCRSRRRRQRASPIVSPASTRRSCGRWWARRPLRARTAPPRCGAMMRRLPRLLFPDAARPPRCSMSRPCRAAEPAPPIRPALTLCRNLLRSRLELRLFRRQLFGLVREIAQIAHHAGRAQAACAPRRCSAHAGSANDAHAAGYFSGTRFSRLSSTASTSLPGARPVRLETRKIWVSTAMVGSPNATFSTTLAVLRPTPGNSSSASRSFGTWPPCFSIRILDSAMTFFALPR